MAVTTNLPPQAYTRDTLVKAIEWLHTQPQTVRERATSADLLVNLYLQARRRQSMQMEASVSGDNFKADLRHLSDDLKQFEEAPAAAPPTHGRSPSSGLFPSPPIQFHPQLAPQPAPQVHTHMHVHAHAPTVVPKVSVWNVDDKSMAAARELQERLNLGSETEALRMLITLGLERARDLFP